MSYAYGHKAMFPNIIELRFKLDNFLISCSFTIDMQTAKKT